MPAKNSGWKSAFSRSAREQTTTSRGPGDEALFNSLSGGRDYLGQLYKTGDHTIDVFLNRAAARRGDTTEYKIVARVTDKKPAPEEKPNTGHIPKKVI